MKAPELKRALDCAVLASKKVGELIRANQFMRKKVNEATQHDIKLDLDVRSQKLIEKTLRGAFPEVPVLGEEGMLGDTSADKRWVVDPIDGTVNFSYGIPHACVSIALQAVAPSGEKPDYEDGYQTLIGAVYDPFCDELWTATRNGRAKLNGRVVRVSALDKLDEAIVSIGFAKTRENLQATLPYFNKLVHQVRKIRIMGSAALALTYVGTGRFDAYIESGIRLWDVAAGGLIVERAGGRFWHEAISGEHAYRMLASNGILHRKLRVPKVPEPAK